MKDIKITRLLAHLFFLFLFIYAFVFYLERMNSDTSFYSFKILSSGSFNPESGRYAIFITQLLPILFIKIGAGLKTILISYSVSFVIVFYLFFLISMYVFGSLRAAIAGTFVLFLGISDTSLYTVTEIHLGMASTAMFYGFTEFYFSEKSKLSAERKYTFLLLGAALILLCLFSHPSTLFPVLFILVFQTIDKNLFKRKDIYILLFMAVVAYGIKYISIDSNSYEGSQLAPFYHFSSLIKNFIHLNSFHFFVKFVLKGVYMLPLALYGITLVYYFISKKYLKLLWSLLSVSGFFILLMIIFSPGDSDMGMEKNLIPLWFFIALPFIHDVLFGNFKFQFARPILYAIVMIVGIAGFYRAVKAYHTRLNYIREILTSTSQETNSSKFIIEKKTLDMDKLIGTWSIANESLLISSINGPENAKTMYLVDCPADLNNFNMEEKEIFLCVSFWQSWNYNSLNPRYFKLPPEPYTYIGTDIHKE
ncbi:MAG: hypothetical protein H6540_03450 [Bacteroidales bacterium]|nr:hypothetical protein [Bacteroidales bacterium]